MGTTFFVRRRPLLEDPLDRLGFGRGQRRFAGLARPRHAYIHKTIRYAGAQTDVVLIVIYALAVAGTRKIHPETRAQSRVRSRIERDDPVGQQKRFVDVVGDKEHGLFLALPNLFKLVLKVSARKRVKRAERFVEKQDVRLHGERARDVHPLAHAARKLGRPPVPGVVEADYVYVVIDER